LALIALIMSAFLLPWIATPAHASSYTFDFSVSDGGWIQSSYAGYSYGGTWVIDQGWHTDSSCCQGAAIEYALPSGVTLNSMLIILNDPGDNINSFDYGMVSGEGAGTCAFGGVIYCNNKNTDTTDLGGHRYQLLINLHGHVTGSGEYLFMQYTMSGGGYVESVTLDHDNLFSPTSTPTLTPTLTVTPTITPTPAPTAIPPGPCEAPWDTTYDFRQSPQGWTGPAGESGIQDGDGYHADDSIDGSNPWWAKHMILTRAIGATGTEITSITLDIDFISGPPGDPDLRKIQVLGPDSSPLINLTSGPSNGQATWTGTAGPGNYSIVVYASGGMPSAPIGGNAVVHSITFHGTGADPSGACKPVSANPDNISWVWPVATGDQVPNGLLEGIIPLSTDGGFDNPFNYLEMDIPAGDYDHNKASVLINTRRLDAWIHSATAGTVVGIASLVDGNNPCSDTTTSTNLLKPQYTCIFSKDEIPPVLDYHNASIVTIQNGSTYLSYLVSSPQVRVGADISPGCILGKPLALYTVGNLVSPTYELSQDGYIIVQGRAGGLPFNILPYLQIEPQDIKCPETGSGGGGGGCKLVHDSAFLNLGDGNWTGDTIPQSPNGGSSGLWVNISPVRQILVLIPDLPYSIDVVAHQLTPTNSPVDFSIQLGGGDPIIVPVTSTSQMETQIAPTVYMPSPSGNFDLVIAPTDNTRFNVAVDFICVNDSVTDPVAPSECILINPNFTDSTGWATTGTVNFLPGMAEITDAGDIHQDVTLSPKDSGPQTYKLIVEARRKGAAAEGESININWSLTAESGGSAGVFGPFADQLSWQTKTDTFEVSAKHTYTFAVEAESDPAGQIVQVQRVCIETNDGTPPPGYQRPPPIPFTASCRVCTYAPIGDVNIDLGEVIGWLFCSISQIWHCQAKTILMGIWQALVNALTLLGFLRLWLSYTFEAGVATLNGDIRVVAAWVNGQLTNLAARIANALLGISTPPTGGSGTSLFDILKLLIDRIASILSQLIDAIKGLALALIQLVLAVITLIANIILTFINQLFGLVRTLLNLIVSAINAPPVVPAGLPDCDPDAAMIKESCLPLFVLDNSVFADSSPIHILIPLLEGMAGFGVLWWALNKFRDTLAGHD